MKNQEQKKSMDKDFTQENKCSKHMHLISVGDSLVSFARKVAKEEFRDYLSRREDSSNKKK